MGSKRLSLDDMMNMREMVTKGVAPEDIARHFSIAVSSVHYYKNRFREQGVEFPNIRGKRPTGSVDIPASADKTPPSLFSFSETTGGELKFIVGGTTVRITGKAKNVTIGETGMQIDF